MVNIVYPPDLTVFTGRLLSLVPSPTQSTVLVLIPQNASHPGGPEPLWSPCQHQHSLLTAN